MKAPFRCSLSRTAAAAAGGWFLAAATVFGQTSPEEVSFPTPDGGVVYAHLYGEGTRAVVLAHGGRFNKESWAAQVPGIVAAGFRVVAIDFRGRGRSRGGGPEGGSSDRDAHFDVMAAVEYLQRTGATEISVVGASFGGWAAANAAVRMPGAIGRLVLLAAGGVEQPERLTGRKLFILTREDASGSGRLRLPAIRAQFDRASEPKKLVVLPGSAHAQFIFGTDQARRLMDEILLFLTEP